MQYEYYILDVAYDEVSGPYDADIASYRAEAMAGEGSEVKILLVTDTLYPGDFCDMDCAQAGLDYPATLSPQVAWWDA